VWWQKWLFWFFEALARVSEKNKCAICERVANTLTHNVFAAWRSGGNRSTKVQFCTKVQSKNFR